MALASQVKSRNAQSMRISTPLNAVQRSKTFNESELLKLQPPNARQKK